jgi:hypothetical protein
MDLRQRIQPYGVRQVQVQQHCAEGRVFQPIQTLGQPPYGLHGKRPIRVLRQQLADEAGIAVVVLDEQDCRPSVAGCGHGDATLLAVCAPAQFGTFGHVPGFFLPRTWP